MLDNEALAVEFVKLEIGKFLPEGSDIGAPATTAELCAQFERIDLFSSKTQRPGVGIRSRREDCRHRIYAGIAQLEPVQIIPARLVTARIAPVDQQVFHRDRKSTRLNSSH